MLKPNIFNRVIFCFRTSLLKNQKEKQKQLLVKLKGLTKKLEEKAEMLGEKLVDTSERHEEILQRL